MKIVPVIDSNGICYVVRKRGLFGSKYLFDDRRFRYNFDSTIFRREKFKTETLAVEKNRDRFGKIGVRAIEEWEG